MFKKNQQDRQEIFREDELDMKLKKMGEKISAPPKLRSAAKSGIPLKVRDAVRTSVHVKRFARAVVAYSLCVCLLVGGVLIVPGLFEGGNVAGSSMSVESQSNVGFSDPEVTTGNCSYTGPITSPETNSPTVDPKFETPICGAALEKLIAGKTNVNAAGMVDLDSLRTEGIELWHSDRALEALQIMFDNDRTLGDCGSAAHDVCAGGWIEEIVDKVVDNGYKGQTIYTHQSGCFYFNLTEAAKVQAYTITPFINNYIFTDRDPIEWTLYATNDPTLPLSQWTVLDYVFDSGIRDAVNGDSESIVPMGYAVDASAQGEYQYYCWNITCVADESVNVDEFALYVE